MAENINVPFTYTRYPLDYDDPRPGVDNKGLPITVDLQTQVKGEVINRPRESILAIESELGIKPSGTFTTVADRLSALEGFKGSLSGDLSGNSTSQTVVGIQGRAVSSEKPLEGDSLVWSEGNNQWQPTYGNTGGSFHLPQGDSNTLLRWAFDELSGTIVNNSGTAGNTATEQITLTANIVRGIRQNFGVGTLFSNSGFASGAGNYAVTGNMSIHVVFTYLGTGGYTNGWILFKPWWGSGGWGAPFATIAIYVSNTGYIGGSVTQAGVKRDISSTFPVITGQPNFISLLIDTVNGYMTLVVNGTPFTIAIVTGNVDFRPGTLWWVGSNYLNTDTINGVVACAMVENTLRSTAWSLAAYKSLVGG